LANSQNHRRKRLSGTVVIFVLIGAALTYAGILLVVQAIGNRLEAKETVEPVGSLDDRFVSNNLTMKYANRVWTYRKRDLTNILLIGIDWEESKTAVSGRYAGQADFLFLITIDKKNKTISTLQLDRDTMTDIRIYGPLGDYTGSRKMQLCLSYVYGTSGVENCDNTVWAVSRLLGNIPIDGCLALDLGAITALNDVLGGVTVTLEDDFSKLDARMTKGITLTLNNKQAEYFVRSRLDVGDGTNASRMRRQKTYIRAAEEILIQEMRSDMNYAGTLYDALSGHLTTNNERGWFINQAYECLEYDRLDTKDLAGIHSVSADGFMEFHPDADALNALLTANYFE
jgi:LCP family protein required for cell wall assembly